MSQQLKESKTKAECQDNNKVAVYLRKDGRWVNVVTVCYTSDGKPIRKHIYENPMDELCGRHFKEDAICRKS